MAKFYGVEGHGRGYLRLLHTNGICLFGEWEISEANEYSPESV